MRKSGFTLVEALVCMALLAGTLLLIMGLFPKGLIQQKQLSTRSTVIEAAADQMNRAIRQDATVLVAGNYPIPTQTLPGGISLQGNLQVTLVGTGPARDFKVTFFWDERSVKHEYHLRQRAFHVSN